MIALRVINDSGHPFTQAKQGDIGFDLHAVVSCPHWIHPRERLKLDTGISIQLPEGYGALVQPRSSMSARGIAALTGVIDQGFRGRIAAVLVNLSDRPYCVEPGDRIAQLVIVPVPVVEVVEVGQLDSSDRGASGFGSTGR